MTRINFISKMMNWLKNNVISREWTGNGPTMNRQSRVMSQSGCSAVDVPMTSYGASDEHPMSIRSASDGTRWNSRGWKYAAMIFAVLVMSVANIGQMWGTDKSYYLFTPTNEATTGPSHTGTLSGHFRCQQSTGNTSSPYNSINGYTFSKMVKTASNAGSWGSNNYGKSYFEYDIKTNETTFTIYYYNNDGSARSIYYYLIEEGQTTYPTANQLGGTTIATKTAGYQSFTVRASTNTRICIGTDYYSNMYFCQIVATEKGTDLVKPGEAGYKIAFNGVVSRYAGKSSSDKSGTINDSIQIKADNDFKYGTNSSKAGGLKIKSNNTQYVSFRTGASACRVKVCVSSSNNYYIATSSSGTTNSSNTTQTVDLAANTRYYINPAGSNVTIDSIVFLSAAASCTAPTSPSITPSNGWLYVPGEEITLTASANNTDASTTYTWYRGSNLASAKAAGAIQVAKTSAQGGTTYTIASCTASDAYKYWCEISNGTGCEASASYDIKLYTFFLYNNDHSNNSSHAFTYIDRTNKKLSVTFDVENSDYTYYFKVSDGLGTWYGKNDYTITSSTNHCDGLSSSGANVGWTTTYPGSYTIDYYYESNNIVIIYPTHNQTAGQTIYFDNHLTDMSNMYIRIGSKNNASASSAITTLVAGTNSLYQASTIAWDGFYAWSIADNGGWTGENTIYQPWNDGGTIKPNGNYTITKQTVFQNYVVGETITLIPTAVNNTEYGCTYYSVDKYSGQKTYTVTTSDNTNCTVTLQKCTNYGSSTYTSLSSGETVLPTQYIKVTVTPTAGYEFDDITITNATEVTAPTAVSPVGVYYVTGDCSISVSCTAASYTVTLNNEDATTAGAASVSATYGSAMPSIAENKPAKTGYTFGGYWSAAAGGGTMYYKTDGTSNKNSDFTAAGNLYAKWTQDITIDDNGGSEDGSATVTYKGTAGTPSVPTYAGHTPDLGYYAESGCTNKVMNLNGSLVASVTVSTVPYTNSSSKWVHAGASTLYAHWKCNTPVISCTDNVVTITVPSGATVYYTTTTDGSTPSDPTSSSTAYNPSSKPTISVDTKITAIAIQSGCTNSDVASESLTYSGAGDGCWDPANTAADQLSSGDVSLTTFENNFSGVSGVTSVTITNKGTSSAGQCSGADEATPSGYMKVKNASSSGNKIITIVISAAKDITIGGENYGSNSGSFKLVKSTDESTALATASTGSTAKASNCVAGTYYIYAIADNKSINFSKLCIEDVAAGYTVTYNYNGATGGASPASATAASVTLPTPTRTDYEFDGWYKTDGTKVGAGGATYNPTANVTLYARWETECSGGGAASTTNVTASGYSTAVEIGSTNVTFTSTPKLGFKYKTATATINSSTTSVTRNNAISCTIASNSSYRGSVKTTSTYTNVDSISFYFAASSSSAGKVIVLYSTDNFADDSTTLLSATAIAKSNNEFMRKTLALPVAKKANTLTFKFRFAPTSSGVTHYIDSLKIYTSTGSGTCYSVKYCGNGATSGYVNDTLSHLSGSNVTVLGNVGRYPFVRAEYTFNGWNTAPGGGGTAYAAGSTISSISSDLTLYAQWLSGTNYTVTYDGNSATSGTAPVDASSPYASGADVTVLGNTGSLAKTGYTFDGWATNNDGTGTSYAEDDEIDNIAANTTLYAKWKQTVTLNTGGQGDGADKTPYIYYNGTSLNGFSAHTAAGYELQGYYTASSGGTKVLNANGTFAGTDVTDYITSSKWSRSATTTLYAQWRASAGSTCYEWDAEETKPRTGTDENFGGLYLTASTKTKVSFYSGHTADSCYSVSKASQILTGHLNGTEIGSVKFKASSSDASNNTFMISFGSTVPFDTAHIIQVSSKDYVVKTVNKNDAAASEYTVTAPAGTKSFAMGRNGSAPHLTGDDLKNSGSRYLYYLYVCSAGGGTHTISYNNGGGSGSMSSHSSIADNGSQTLTSNTFTAPTNYTFAGWVADKDVTIGGDTKRAGTLIADGATITNITTDINLTAKWGLDLKLETGSQGTDADEDLTVYYNSTSITGHTPHTAGGYRLLGYYTADEDGTKVLNADGTFAATAITGYIADGKWTYTTASSLTLYGQWEASSLLKWNLQTNKSETSITTTSKESATARIITENMTNLTNNGSLTITGSAKSGLTSKIATTAGTTGDDAGKYMSVQFQIANGYKLVPTAINVKAQPISHSQRVYLVLEDNHSQSINHTSSSISKGSTQTVTMTNDGGTEFTGTVTLKIYCYGTAENDGYRLGSPIEINGSVEEACTMPSYDSLTYSQTEYLKDAVASAIVVNGGADVTTYLWKSNTSNDRSGGSAASGTNNTASYTPSTSANGTTYYWCELTNACGTVKTPAVGITVRTDKTDPTVAWTNPAGTVHYGGGNYTLRATVNETAWDGTLDASMLTAPAGIRIYGATTGTDGSSRNYIEVKFDVQTSFDKTTYASNIPFTLSLPETTNYDAVDDDHNVAYEACSGAGAGSSYDIRVRQNVTKVDNNYYCWLNTDGWLSPNPNNSISTSSIKEAESSMGESNQFDTIYDTNSQTVFIRTFHANINKVRIYAKFNANDMTVTNVYKHTTYFTPGSTYEIDADEYTVVYNDDESAEDLGTSAQGYVDITLNTGLAANDIICVKFNTSRVRPLGAEITEASGGSVSTTLTFASAGPIAKTVGDAAFSNVATTSSKSLGAITYTSSSTSVATVNASTGAVTLVGEGSTTITATLAASGCFESKTATYTLNVSAAACTDVAGTVTTRDLACDGTELTVSGYTEGATIQWYKDDVSMGGSYVAATCTVTVAGEYYAVTHKDCDKASNTVTVAAKTVTATKLVDSWYVKNGRLTPDIALVQTTGATSFTVTSGGSPITSIGGCQFYLGDDGIIYLKGAQEDGSAPSGMTLGDQTITITASVCSTDATPLDIVIHRQVATDKHVLAFVVTGTAKGGFTDGITAAQTTSVPLYTTLTENFDVLATNIYSTDDEKKLKEYYSQFDILCVTDYPNTGTKGVNKKSYVDALGSLIDIRPILTMEAFVSKLDNWKAKGVSGTPSSPSERQYTMLLQCKDHEIFAGTTLTKIGEGDETMYRVSMVDNTMEEYVSLDVNAPGTKAYDAGGKPALQGFTFTTEMSNNDLLPLGLIDDGAGNDLQVGIERQHAMEARLMVLGINGYAMERLTDDGMQIIVNALKYLMKKNTEDIADCSTSFIGGDPEVEGEATRYDWHNAAHWTGNALPQVSQKVRILTKCIIRSGQETPHVAGVVIAPRGKYNHGSNEAAGSLTIEQGAALIVDGKVEAATSPYYNKPYATSAGELAIITSASGNGVLAMGGNDGSNRATVAFYTKAHKDGSGNWINQFIGTPFEPGNDIYNDYYGSYIYEFDPTQSDVLVDGNDPRWINKKRGYHAKAFQGYNILRRSTTNDVLWMDGQLCSSENRELSLHYKGSGRTENMFANSWMAPIDVASMTGAFTNCEATVYIFNAGSVSDIGNNISPTSAGSASASGAGQYIVLPVASAPWVSPTVKVIPSMQAFSVYATGADAELVLDYKAMVLEPAKAAAKADLTAATRTPRRSTARDTNKPDIMRLRVSAESGYADVIHVLMREDFTTGFENGYDGRKMMGNEEAPQMYAISEAGNMTINCVAEAEGTVIGFKAGEDSLYTFTFSYDGDETYYLNDIKEQKSTLIDAENVYVFTIEKGDDEHRFYISRTPHGNPGTATGVSNTEAMPKVQKFIYQDKLYILRNGVLYDATGKVVR